MEKANLTKENTKASSGGPRDWGDDPIDDDFGANASEYNEMYNTLFGM